MFLSICLLFLLVSSVRATVFFESEAKRSTDHRWREASARRAPFFDSVCVGQDMKLEVLVTWPVSPELHKQKFHKQVPKTDRTRFNVIPLYLTLLGQHRACGCSHMNHRVMRDPAALLACAKHALSNR